MKIYSIFAALILILSACVQVAAPAPQQYAGIVVVYQNGQATNAKVMLLSDSQEKCEQSIQRAIADIGTPPPGITAELSCVELVPFQKIDSSSQQTSAPRQPTPPVTRL